MKLSTTVFSLFVLGALAAPLAEPENQERADVDERGQYGNKVEVVYYEPKKSYDNYKQWTDDKKKYWDDKRHQWLNDKNQCWDTQKQQWVDKNKYDSSKKVEVVYETPKPKEQPKVVYETPKPKEQPKVVVVEYVDKNGNKWDGKHWDGKKGNGYEVIQFQKSFNVKATPETVIATDQTARPGQPGAVGYFKLGINGAKDTICFEITLHNVVGPYSSPARTATHLHEAPKGRSGPPRIAFPNPVGDDKYRYSSGCLTGPFVTGINATGTTTDTGSGFKVQQILDNPSNFFADTHTVDYPAGAVRGQLA